MTKTLRDSLIKADEILESLSFCSGQREYKTLSIALWGSYQNTGGISATSTDMMPFQEALKLSNQDSFGHSRERWTCYQSGSALRLSQFVLFINTTILWLGSNLLLKLHCKVL